MKMNLKPDLEFIESLKKTGGESVKKCYQCASCSVACPLSSDQKPFPRKEMIWAQWGLKETLFADPDVLLCHQCGDCTEICPRGARPAEVLGAIRASLYTFYSWPTWLARLATRARNLPVLIGLPFTLILVLWYLSGAMHVPSADVFARYGYTRFFGHWDFEWYAKNTTFIVSIMLPTAGLATFSVAKGVVGMWQAMRENAKIKTNYRPSVPMFITEFLWPSLVETMKHRRFRECTANNDRVKGHLPLVLGFIGAFILTCWSAIRQDLLGLIWPSFHGPLPLTDPFKILANISAIALLYGTWVLWGNRRKREKSGKAGKTFYDWFLIGEITAVGCTGLGAELLRWAGMPAFGYTVYFLHLVSIMMLFLYMPYTKFAHIVYRTMAMCFEKFRESGFAKNTLDW
jgi:quinone-modifying oxidoreductase, subunit QmoC